MSEQPDREYDKVVEQDTPLDEWSDEGEQVEYALYSSGLYYVWTEEEDSHICDECGDEFDTVKGLAGHMNIHSEGSEVSEDSEV